MKNLFNTRYKIACHYSDQPLEWWCFDAAVGAIVKMKFHRGKSIFTCTYDEFIELADKYWKAYPDKACRMIWENCYDKEPIKSVEFNLKSCKNMVVKDIKGRTISVPMIQAVVISSGIDYYNFAIQQYPKAFLKLKQHVELLYPNIIKSIHSKKENIIFEFQF